MDGAVLLKVFDEEGSALVWEEGSVGRALAEDFLEKGEASSGPRGIVGVEGNAKGLLGRHFGADGGFKAFDGGLSARAAQAGADDTYKAAGAGARKDFFHDGLELLGSQLGKDDEVFKGDDVPKVTDALLPGLKWFALVEKSVKNSIDRDLAFLKSGKDRGGDQTFTATGRSGGLIDVERIQELTDGFRENTLRFLQVVCCEGEDRGIRRDARVHIGKHGLRMNKLARVAVEDEVEPP